jgi:hypothetical protein
MINGRRPELVVLNVQDAMTVAAGHWIVRKLVISIICRGRLAGGGESVCASVHGGDETSWMCVWSSVLCLVLCRSGHHPSVIP